jgi:Flp pilus assembly pilin Flp
MIRKKKRLGGKTRAGRLMKRLLGDTAGGVLMEYVVLGLLIVAAVAAAVIMFGDSIKNGFKTMTSVTTGETGQAKTDADAARKARDAAAKEGGTVDEYRKSMIKY